MEEKDGEIWIGENRLYLGEDNIISVSVVGDVDEEKAIGFKEAGLKLANLLEGKVNVLIDLNKAGKLAPKAREVVQELSVHEKTGKVAAFGLHPVARVIATFGMGANFTKGYFRFFKTEGEALAWLKR